MTRGPVTQRTLQTLRITLLALALHTGLPVRSQCADTQIWSANNSGLAFNSFVQQLYPYLGVGCSPYSLVTGFDAIVLPWGSGSYSFSSGFIANPPPSCCISIDEVLPWSFEGHEVLVHAWWGYNQDCMGLPGQPYRIDCTSDLFYFDKLNAEAFNWSVQADCSGGMQRLVLTDKPSDPGNMVDPARSAYITYQLIKDGIVAQSGALSSKYDLNGPSFIFENLAPGGYELRFANGFINASPGTTHYAYWNAEHAAQRFVVPAVGDCGINLPVRLILSGMGNNFLMDDDLRAQGLLPLTEPYTALGYTYPGGTPGATVPSATFSTTGPDAIVDWVVIELRSATVPSTIIESRAGLLQRDGDVVDVNGDAWLNFTSPAGSYLVAVRHRNHLGVRTAAPVLVGPGTLGVDLSRPWMVHGTQPLTIYDSPYGPQPFGSLVGGDANFDGTLRYTGSNNDRDPILVRIGGAAPHNTVSGYYQEDLTMDGVVKYIGSGNDRDMVLYAITGGANIPPTTIRVAQLP
jgi:hypothetical protein